MPASRTTKTLRPAELTQILPTGLLASETRLELGQIPGIIFHRPRSYILGSPESSKYPSKPVILTGVSTHWRAMTEWTPEYLKSVAGDSTITVHFDPDANFHRCFLRCFLRPWERVGRELTLAEFLDILLAEPADPRYYLGGWKLASVSTGLSGDVDFSGYIDDDEPHEPLLFLGRDVCVPLHYHGTTESFVCQLQGSKWITLYSPDQYSLLYARSWFSRIDGRQIRKGQPDYDAFPKFREARPIDFMLHPGEILFIPVHWWHLTSISGYQVSVAHFWRASLRRWHFPTPGLQVLGQELLKKAPRARAWWRRIQQHWER